mgnify:CR=1 FL=1
MSKRKNVLIISYYWPPSGGAGVQRWLKFVKYLRDFGWEPIVYTPSNPEFPVLDETLSKEVPEGIKLVQTPIWEPYSAYKIFTGRKKNARIGAGMLSEKKKSGVMDNLSIWIRGNFFIPDARKFWIKPSVRFLTTYLNENKIDAIVSTGPPHSMHLIALGLKKKFPRLPWIADFRDPWTNIDFYQELGLMGWADRKHHRLERAVLDTADRVVCVGKTWTDELRQLASPGKQLSERFDVIMNGFDDADVFKGDITRDEKFSLAHIGTLNKSRNPHLLWEVLKKECASNKLFAEKLEIKLVGKVDAAVLASIENAGLTPYLKLIDYLPHGEVLRIQQECRVLLLLVNDTPNSKGIITGKYFEYMASRTPVLTIGPENGDLAEVMRESGCGLLAGFKDEEKLQQHIRQFFAAFSSGKEDLFGGDIDRYSRRSRTGRYAVLLDRISSGG